MLCIYLFIFMSIICGWLWCCGYIPRCVLNHLLDLIWEVLLGGRNLISSRHEGIFMFLLNAVPFYFKLSPSPSPFTLMSSLLISYLNPPPFYLLYSNIYIYVCVCVCVYTHTHTLPSSHLKKKIFYISLLIGF